MAKYTAVLRLEGDFSKVLATMFEPWHSANRKRVEVFDEDKKKVDREVFHVTWDVDAAEKEGYEHFMLKEIYEQPKGLSETLCI